LVPITSSLAWYQVLVENAMPVLPIWVQLPAASTQIVRVLLLELSAITIQESDP